MVMLQTVNCSKGHLSFTSYLSRKRLQRLQHLA
jgi:hypothetical protein